MSGLVSKVSTEKSRGTQRKTLVCNISREKTPNKTFFTLLIQEFKRVSGKCALASGARNQRAAKTLAPTPLNIHPYKRCFFYPGRVLWHPVSRKISMKTNPISAPSGLSWGWGSAYCQDCSERLCISKGYFFIIIFIFSLNASALDKRHCCCRKTHL